MVRPRADRECQHTPESACGCLSLCVTKIIPPFSVCLCLCVCARVDRLNLTEFKIKSYHSDLEHILVFLGAHGGVCLGVCVCVCVVGVSLVLLLGALYRRFRAA